MEQLQTLLDKTISERDRLNLELNSEKQQLAHSMREIKQLGTKVKIYIILF